MNILFLLILQLLLIDYILIANQVQFSQFMQQDFGTY